MRKYIIRNNKQKNEIKVVISSLEKDVNYERLLVALNLIFSEKDIFDFLNGNINFPMFIAKIPKKKF